MVMKAVPLLALLYVISPVDFVPDFIPGLGQLDDLGIVLAALELFVRLCPGSAHTYHREAITQRRRYSPMTPTDDVIDAELNLVTNGGITTDCVDKDSMFSNSFPFLAAANN